MIEVELDLEADEFLTDPVFATFDGDPECVAEAERHDAEKAAAELAILAARRAYVMARYMVRKRRTQSKRVRVLNAADAAAAFGAPRDALNERAEELLADAAARAEAMHAAVAVIDAEAAAVRLRLRQQNETRERQRREEEQIQARHEAWKAKHVGKRTRRSSAAEEAEAEARRLAEAADLAAWADQKYGELAKEHGAPFHGGGLGYAGRPDPEDLSDWLEARDGITDGGTDE